MSPVQIQLSDGAGSFPRVSGDEPPTDRRPGAGYGFSPRERG